MAEQVEAALEPVMVVEVPVAAEVVLVTGEVMLEVGPPTKWTQVLLDYILVPDLLPQIPHSSLIFQVG